MIKFISGLFQPWNYMGSMKFTVEHESILLQLFGRDGIFHTEISVMFFEKANGQRKIDIVGADNSDKKRIFVLVKPKIYTWLYDSGQLPVGVTKE